MNHVNVTSSLDYNLYQVEIKESMEGWYIMQIGYNTLAPRGLQMSVSRAPGFPCDGKCTRSLPRYEPVIAAIFALRHLPVSRPLCLSSYGFFLSLFPITKWHIFPTSMYFFVCNTLGPPRQADMALIVAKGNYWLPNIS